MKNRIIWILIIILLVLIIGVVCYKVNIDKNNRENKLNDNNESVAYDLRKTIEIDIDNADGQKDREKYKDNIIEEDMLSVDYSFFDDNNSIVGKFYIANDKTLHVTEENTYLDIKVSNEKYKTMFVKKYEYSTGVFVFLLTDKGKVNVAHLSSNNIKDINIVEFNFPLKITNFTNLEFENDIYPSAMGLFVLAENGNIYDLLSKIRYNDNIYAIYNLLYVLEDKTMTDEYGRIFKNDKKNYKIKYVFINYDTESAELIIITEDDEMIAYNINYSKSVYEYTKKVKNVEMNDDLYNPFNKTKIKIIFEDNSEINFNGACSKFFCPISFNL